MVHDRDTKFSFAFDRLFFNSGIRRARTPLLAPDANAFAESWIGKLKTECLDHFLCFGLGHFDHIAQEYVWFFNLHRPHQGLGNAILPEAGMGPPTHCQVDADVGQVRCQRFLGGLLRHYERDAA